MMRRFAGVAGMLLLAVAARGQDPATMPAPESAQATAAFLAPYTDSQTLLLVHADLGRVDSRALFAFVDGLLAKVPDSQDARKALPMAQTAFDVFLVRLKQLGVRHVYLISDQTQLTMAGMEGAAVGGVILAPLPAGTDPAPVIAFYQAMGLDRSLGVKEPTVLPGNVLAVGGAPEEMARFRQASATPVSTAELTAAFAADDGAALQVVGLLSRDAQRVLTEMPFTLPPSLGGQSILDYTQGLDAVTLAVDLPPRPAVTAALTAQDEAAAQRLAAAFNGLFKSIPQTPWFTQELHTDSPARKEALRKLLTAMVFTASGRTATVRLEGEELAGTLASLLAPDVGAAQEQSLRVQSATQMRQLMVACMTYAEKHDGDFPPSLQTLLDEKLITDPNILASPRPLKDKTLVYHPWTAEQLKKLSPSETPMIWEHPDTPSDGLNVAFADGHIEFMKQQQVVNDLLQAAEKKLK